jgi:hypothetical protein
MSIIISCTSNGCRILAASVHWHTPADKSTIAALETATLRILYPSYQTKPSTCIRWLYSWDCDLALSDQSVLRFPLPHDEWGAIVLYLVKMCEMQ